MIIKSIHIDSFGSLKNRDFTLDEGLNIIEGKNESGKSTIATFIKFMLYGLSGRKTDSPVSDKSKFASWDTGMASGSMVICVDGHDYRIEREYFSFSDAGTSESSKDRCVVTELSCGERVFKNEIPGMALLGIPEQLFVNTAFVRQLSDAKIDGVGMADAMENLLMSGDEGVSTKKAVEKLEKERVSLKHKTGSGGLVNDLQREVIRLGQKLSEVSRESADVIELESGVEELQQTVSDREKECRELSELCSAYEKIAAKRKRDEAQKCLCQMDEAEEKLEAFRQYGDIDGNVRRIIELSSHIKTAEEKQKILRRRESELNSMLPPVMSEDDKENAREDVRTARKIAKKRGGRIAFGIFLLFISVAIVAADIIINPPYHSIFLSAAAVVLGISALIIASGAKNSSKYKKIMRRWNAENTNELERCVRRQIEAAEQRENPDSEYCMTVATLQQTEAQRISNITELRETAALFTYEMSDTDLMAQAALEKARSISEEKSKLLREINEIRGRYSVLSDSLSVDTQAMDSEAAELLQTEIGKKAAEMTAADAENCRRRKGFAENTLPSLRAQLGEKENRLGVLRATTASPAAVAAQLGAVKAQLRDAADRYEAIVLAIESLTTAGDRLRRSLIPRVRLEAERIMGNFTDGKYVDLGLDRRFDVTFNANGKTRDSVYFSAGTRDVAYISLRMALCHVMFAENTPPQIFDESFARVDEERLEKIMKFLDSDGSDMPQSLLFTCRSLEGELAQKNGSVNIISL